MITGRPPAKRTDGKSEVLDSVVKTKYRNSKQTLRKEKEAIQILSVDLMKMKLKILIILV